MKLKRYHVLLGTLLTATALTGGAALYGQAPAPLWDATQLPETKGAVKQYTLTPRGDVDGLILTDGIEIKLPPHSAAFLTLAGCAVVGAVLFQFAMPETRVFQQRDAGQIGTRNNESSKSGLPLRRLPADYNFSTGD